RTPRASSFRIAANCSSVGSANRRAVRSAAMSVRASRRSMVRKEVLNPRTPVNDPTPAATARTTNRNLARDARASLRAIFRAVDQRKRSAMLLNSPPRAGGHAQLQLIAGNFAVAQHDD